MLANKQNLDNFVAERSSSDKKKIFNVEPIAQVTGRSASERKPTGGLAIAPESNRQRVTIRDFVEQPLRKETPLVRTAKKDCACQTEDEQQIASANAEANALDWMYSEEEPSLEYWKELANSREKQLRDVVEECDALRRQIELVSNLNQYLMAQLEERDANLSDE